MPFTVKDALHYKRNDRQIREIHEREYANYLTSLHRQQPSHRSKTYYLSSDHIHEIERSRRRHSLEKQNQFDRIQRENFSILDRLRQASKRPTIDDRNHVYQQNLQIFNSKHDQQRFNEYQRIYHDNQLLLQRIKNTQGQLITKEQCDHDWTKHVNVMKNTCDYPENIDRFTTKRNQTEQQQACRYAKIRSAQWNKRHCIMERPTRSTITPLAILLHDY